MRLPLGVASLLLLILVVFFLLRLPRADAPWSLLAYLFCHLVFLFVTLAVLQRLSLSHERYTTVFYALLYPTLALALWFACRACWESPLWLVVPASLLFSGVIGFVVATYYSRSIGEALGQETIVFILCGAVFISCGLSSLLSLMAPASPALSASRFALGSFWLVQGAFNFCLLRGLAQNRMEWVSYNEWIPSLIAVVLFSWWAWTISPRQLEGTRAPDASVAAISGPAAWGVVEGVTFKVRRTPGW